MYLLECIPCVTGKTICVPFLLQALINFDLVLEVRLLVFQGWKKIVTNKPVLTSILLLSGIACEINPKRMWAEITCDKIKQVEISGICRK
jgi:hypothetical protein